MPDATNPFSFANNYRKDGWQGTLWLPYRQKSAPPSGYHGWGAPYPSELDLAKWRKRGDGNIALRLGKLDPGYVPEGGKPCGYELVGIDIDDYRDKHGWNELLELEGKLGKLPPTVCSTSRWEQSEHTYTAVFMIPTGYILKGKAADCIDILYAGNRYLVVHPSIHPEGMTYEWRYGSGSTEWQTWDDGIPSAYECALLPEPWFEYLKRDNQSAYEKSDLGSSDLRDWATSTFRDGEPCNWMRLQTDKKIAELQNSPTSHDHLNNDTWYLTKLACEGHVGWRTCIVEYSNAWAEHAAEMRDADVDFGEINRCIDGAIAKNKVLFDKGEIENQIEPGVMADDDSRCQPVDPHKTYSGGWIDGEFDDEAIAAGDYGGLGPVIGPMEVGPTKPAEEYGMHDDGNGEHLIDLYGNDIKYVDGRDGWAIWSGGRWHQDKNGRDVGIAYRRVRWAQEQLVHRLRLAKAADPENKAIGTMLREWSGWAKRSGNVTGINNALDRAEGQYVRGTSERVAMPTTQFDSNPNLLGCKNGVIDLDADCLMRQPIKEDYVTFNTKVNYVPWDTETAEAAGLLESYQLWLEYLDLFLPDPHPDIDDYRRFVQKVLGYCLVGANPEKLLIFLYGPHDTGKSTLLGAIKGALGDYYGQIDQSLFRQRDLNPALIRAVPLRVTGMSELDNSRIDGPTIKRLTGNDTVTAEAKHSNDIFQGKPQFTTLIACNSVPDISNADEALKERILILPFETQVEREKRNYGRQSDLENLCGEAVLAWLVEGWKMYMREGLKRSAWPKYVRELVGEVTDNFNSTQTFVADNLESWTRSRDGIRAQQRATKRAMLRGSHVASPADWDEEWTPSSERVYSLYVNWCAVNKVVPPLSSIQFSKEAGLGRSLQRWNSERRKNEKRYVGWRIKLDGDNAETV